MYSYLDVIVVVIDFIAVIVIFMLQGYGFTVSQLYDLLLDIRCVCVIYVCDCE